MNQAGCSCLFVFFKPKSLETHILPSFLAKYFFINVGVEDRENRCERRRLRLIGLQNMM